MARAQKIGTYEPRVKTFEIVLNLTLEEANELLVLVAQSRIAGPLQSIYNELQGALSE